MSSRKRVMIIIVWIALLLLFITRTGYLQSHINESLGCTVTTVNTYRGEGPLAGSAVIEQKDQLLPGMNVDNIFFGQNFDSIAMYGDPKNWDDEKNMCIDTNDDGQNDICFTIASSRKGGIELDGSVKQSNGSWKSMNFWSSDLYKLLRHSLQGKVQNPTVKAKDFLTLDIASLVSLLQEGKYIVKGGCIVDDDYVQISVCDIDEDGTEEVLASVGNQRDESVTAIYEFSYGKRTPFIYRGSISCGTVVEYKGGGILWAYDGSLKDGLHDTYSYNGKMIKKLRESLQ